MWHLDKHNIHMYILSFCNCKFICTYLCLLNKHIVSYRVNVRHRVTLWPILPHEKHTTVVQSRRMGPSQGRGAGAGFSGSRLCSKVSKSEFPAAGTGTGCRAWVPANKRCNNCSTIGGSGFGAGAGAAVPTNNHWSKVSNWCSGDCWVVTAATLSSSIPLSEPLTIYMYVGNVWFGPVYWPAEHSSLHDSPEPVIDQQYPVSEFPAAHCPYVEATHK